MPKVNSKLFRLVAFTRKHLARRSICRFRSDILHETYYSVDDYRPAGSKSVLMVYDLIHERYLELFERSHMTTGPKKAAALRADHVNCISESTLLDVIEFCEVLHEKNIRLFGREC